jgi:cation diffusion facilitator CzcD-associated flavoprotein CzcO
MRITGAKVWVAKLAFDRYTPGSGYLEALAAKNSTVIFNGIDHIDEDGLVTMDGQKYVVDAIICATGFDTSYRPAFPVVGINGRNLATYWNDEPLHYLSVAAPGFPNYFSK